MTWVELKKVVARKTKLTEKEVNLILTTWLDEMSAALNRGEDVHINGLGTFRKKKMAARKSVNVKTGETIIIPEQERITYAMAANVEDQLNNAKPTILPTEVDPLKKLGGQAEEIVDLLGEMGQGPKAKSDVDANVNVDKNDNAPIIIVQEVKKEEKKRKPWLIWGIIIIILILLLLAGLFFFQNRIQQWIDTISERTEMGADIPTDILESENIDTLNLQEVQEPSETTQVVESESESESESEREKVTTNISKATPKTKKEKKEFVPVDYQVPTKVYSEYVTKTRLKAGSTLSELADKFYGNRELWVYIFDANRDHIARPNEVEVGTIIRIPVLEDNVIQQSTPEIRNRTEFLRMVFLGEI